MELDLISDGKVVISAGSGESQDSVDSPQAGFVEWFY
jgi:hypothetical protein